MRKFIDIISEDKPVLEAQDILGPDESDEFDEPVDEDWERAKRVEKHVKEMCYKQFGWELGSGFAVSYDTDNDELSITLDDEVTLDQLQTLKVMGDNVKVTGSSNYRIIITVVTHKGLDVPH